MLEKDALGAIAPTEILFEFEEPLTFLCRDRDGGLLLAHSLSAEPGRSRYLVSISDPRIITELKAGRLDVLGALRQPRCWIVEFGPGWEILDLWLIPFDEVPKDLLPKPGAMLTPDLEPLFRIRLIGSGVGPGKTSAADVRMAAQATEMGLRGLARLALDEKKQVGPVTGDVRHYSDLPYQYSRAASFEIAFGRPRDRLPGLDDEVFDEMGRLLELGLIALRAEGDDLGPVEGLNADQALQLFEAIRALTPPTRGDINRIELGGALTDGFKVSNVLTRDDRIRSVQRVKAVHHAPRREEPFRVTGVIEAVDQGTATFTLRQLDPPDVPVVGAVPEIRFHFEEYLYDIVMEAFFSLERVVIVGELIDSDYLALKVQMANEVSPETTDGPRRGESRLDPPYENISF
jgi:hypothetical protein